VKRWIIRLFIGLLSFFLLLFAALLLLLGTESGVRWLTDMTQEHMPEHILEELKIGRVEGHLLGHLQLSNIHLQSPAGKLDIGTVLFSWKPSELLGLHLHIKEFSVVDIEFAAVPSEPDSELEEAPSEEPVILPQLELPLRISLDKLAVQNVRFISAPDARPVIVDNAGLAFQWDKSGITLKQLAVRMPEGHLQSSGTINPVGSYPLQLQLDAASTMETMPRVKLSGGLSGDLQALNISQHMTGDITAVLNFDLAHLLTEPSWKGKIEISDLRPALFSPEVGGVLKGDITAQGDLSSSTLQADLKLRDEALKELNWDAELDLQADLEHLAVQIKNLHLKHVDTHADTTGEFILTGVIDAQQQFDLQGNWQSLQWPLGAKPDVRIPRGKFTLQGKAEDYALEMTTRVEGDQLPAGDWKLQAKGDMEQLNITRLSGNTLEGIIGLAGQVKWQPNVQWTLELDGKDINPGVLSADWPGKLGWAIKSEGSVEEAGVHAQLTIAKIDGSLRELPIVGGGNISISPDKMKFDGLHLSSGSAKLTAEGSLADHAAIHWQTDIADFADLLPDAAGSLRAHGSIKGKLEQPQLLVTAVADQVKVADISLNHLDLNADVDLSWKQPFSLKLVGQEIQAAGQLIKQVDIQGKGSLEQHTLKVNAGHEMATLNIMLKGGYLEEQWQGMIQVLNIDSADLGTWSLSQPANLSASAKEANLRDFCLQRDSTSLCADGHWFNRKGFSGKGLALKEESKGNVQLKNFPLTWLQPWLPEPIEQVDGVFSTQASVKMNQDMQVNALAEITPGNIIYTTEKAKGSIPHQGGKVDLKIDQGSLDADFLLSLDENRISGKFKSPDILKVETLEQAALAGELIIDARKFDLVEVLVPDVKDLDVVIDAHFNLGGKLNQPILDGKGSLLINQALIPLAGLDLRDTRLDITSSKRTVNIDGVFNSPDGHLKLNGEITLDGEKNWPARLTLKGENFRLVNLPEAQVNISPDLLLETKPDRISLTGEAVIPRAEVLLRDIPAGAKTASDDVVIKGDETAEEKEQTTPLYMNIKLALGKDVHFVGFGLNAFIDGQLTINSEPGEPIMGSGEFHIEQGTFQAYGQDLDIEKGIISFPGGPLSKPGINLRATRTVGEVIAGINAIGPAAKPRLTTFSTPPMAERDVISFLLIGRAASDTSGGATLSVGRQINNKLSVSVGADVKTGDTEVITRYRINRKIHAEFTTSSQSNAADIFYTMELGGKAEEKAVEKKQPEKGRVLKE
jgi:translocation and assembly module TamB